MPKYKLTFKRQRICEDEVFFIIEAKTKKEAEEKGKKYLEEDIENKDGSVSVYKDKVYENGWKLSVSKGE